MIFTITPNPALDRTLTVHEIVFDEMVRAADSRLDLDGKGVNVSKALRALGEATVIMGFAGGAAGEQLERGLGAMGLATDFTRVAGETRTNTMILDAAGRYVKANEPGPTVSPEELAALLARVREQARPGDTWICSGSLPPGAPADLYAQLVLLIQSRGARALLDTSGEPLRLGCAAAPFLAKPNAGEAGELTGQPVDGDQGALRAAEAMLGQGIELVALSLGADGVLLASRGRALRARPPRVSAPNPVGAGDALLAGIAWALERGLPLEDLARWGVASGTAAAMREGTGPAPRAAVEALYAQVQVDECG
ncbi:MAG: 1-phosphofructokinase [Kouleothrix sp.]|nr:1-phosphofructokinase [Kouleothrix sp.]